VLLNSICGVRDVEPLTLDMGRVYGLGRFARLRRIVLPSAVPYIATGVHVASSIALILAVTAELVIGSPGLGRAITVAEGSGAIDLMYTLVFATGVLGLVLNALLWVFDRVGSDVVPSVARLLVGYGLSAAIGIGLGLFLGLHPVARAFADPLTHFLRSIPAPALIPPALVVLGLGSGMNLFVIVLGAVWPILLNTIDGVRAQDPTPLEMACAYGIGDVERVRRIVLPAAAPQIFAGLRTCRSR
jgi:ABC-type nitrate/sulfonate/bicarbonate transport system permease component